MEPLALKDYLRGHEKEHPEEFTKEVKANALFLLGKVNLFLTEASKELLIKVFRVASGWRPKAFNLKVGGRKASKHITGEAIDIEDPDKRLAAWALRNPHLLEALNLAIEDPFYTPGWLHIQSVLPKSGRRVFIP